jgi:hypothetical protein
LFYRRFDLSFLLKLLNLLKLLKFSNSKKRKKIIFCNKIEKKLVSPKKIMLKIVDRPKVANGGMDVKGRWDGCKSTVMDCYNKRCTRYQCERKCFELQCDVKWLATKRGSNLKWHFILFFAFLSLSNLTDVTHILGFGDKMKAEWMIQ